GGGVAQRLGALQEAGQREHRVDRPLWSARVRRAEVEYLGDVAGGRIPRRQRREAEPPLDQPEDRGVVVGRVRDRAALRERRDDQGRYPEPAQPGHRRVHVRGGGRRYVVEEAAPLVEGDDQYRSRPRRRLGDRAVHAVHGGLTVADVAVRVVVLGQPVDRLQEQRRVHIGHRRQVTGRRVVQERVVGVADAEVLQAPQGQERQVVVVVL